MQQRETGFSVGSPGGLPAPIHSWLEAPQAQDRPASQDAEEQRHQLGAVQGASKTRSSCVVVLEDPWPSGVIKAHGGQV